MNLYRKSLPIIVFGLLLIPGLSTISFAQVSSNPEISSKKDLLKHDFFYAGEAKVQDMYIVKNGKIVWEYKGPRDQGEISDAERLSNGNLICASTRHNIDNARQEGTLAL